MRGIEDFSTRLPLFFAQFVEHVDNNIVLNFFPDFKPAHRDSYNLLLWFFLADSES